jgi:hypothetical protein
VDRRLRLLAGIGARELGARGSLRAFLDDVVLAFAAMTRMWLILVLVSACGGKRDKAPEAHEAPPPTAPAKAASPTAEFWSWFATNGPALRADKDLRHTMDAISKELEKVHPGVFAEIGGDGDNRTLVLSVDGKKELFPAVQELYAARPTVPGWTIVAFRQRAKPGDPALTIELGDRKLDPKLVKVVATPAADKKLDIVVYIPGFTTNDEMGSLGFVILDHVVGEYDMETRIAGVDFAPLDKAPANAKPLDTLPTMVDALK